MVKAIEENMILFVNAYQVRLGVAGCTWKFHIFQHFLELIQRHGSALFWDGYFRESIVGYLKMFLTGTRNQDEQVVANFLRVHHARKYFETCKSSPRMKEFYEKETKRAGFNVMLENVGFEYLDRVPVTDE